MVRVLDAVLISCFANIEEVVSVRIHGDIPEGWELLGYKIFSSDKTQVNKIIPTLSIVVATQQSTDGKEVRDLVYLVRGSCD